MKLFTKVLLPIIALTTVVAQEPEPAQKRSINYISAGAIYFLPTVGFGHRWQNEHGGTDVSIEGATIGVVSTIFANVRGLYFINPNEQSFYLGVGVGAGAIFGSGSGGGFYSPQAIFGYKLNERRFFEFDIHFPQGSSHRWNTVAAPVFRFGFAF